MELVQMYALIKQRHNFGGVSINVVLFVYTHDSDFCLSLCKNLDGHQP